MINARKRKPKVETPEEDYRDLEARVFAEGRECHALAKSFARFYSRSEYVDPEAAWPAFLRKYDEMANQAAIDAHREWTEAQRVADYKKLVYEILCREMDAAKVSDG